MAITPSSALEVVVVVVLTMVEAVVGVPDMLLPQILRLP
jgi:hypothetical protein